MSDKMTKIDRPVLVAQICHLSKVENEFEQLLNLPERQVSSYDASMFDDEKEAIENIELESEEGTAWSLHHIAPLTAQVPLYQGANTAANVNLSMAVNYSGPKSQLRDSLLSKASLHGPRQNEPLSSLSARPVLNTKVLNAQVSSTQTAGIQAASSQGPDMPDMQVLSQKATIIKVFSITPSVVAQGNIQSEVSIDGITSTETVKRLSSLTQSQLHQSPQPNNAAGRNPMANAAVLMSKVPTQREAVSKEPVSKEAVSKEPVSKEAVSKEPVSKEPVSKEPVSKEPVSKEPVSKEPVSREPVSREPVSREPVSKEPVPKEPVPKEPVSKEPVSKEAVSKEAVSKEPVSKEAVSKEPVSKEPVSKEPVSKEPVSKLPLSKESTVASKLVEQSFGKFVHKAQFDSNTNQPNAAEGTKLQHVLTSLKPHQPSTTLECDTVVNAPVLMSKVPVVQESIAVSKFMDPSIGMLVREAESEPSTKQHNAGEGTKLQRVLTPLKSVTQMQPELSANRSLEMRGNSHAEKTAVLVPLNTEVRENTTQASVMLTQEEASPVLLTRMELFGFGAKLAAGHMLTSVQPVLFSPVLHYQIAPEYFTHYAQLNTYRVFFRNKYYLFQFEDHKVTNFLEGYYDRH